MENTTKKPALLCSQTPINSPPQAIVRTHK
jgi:hypothetical protein